MKYSDAQLFSKFTTLDKDGNSLYEGKRTSDITSEEWQAMIVETTHVWKDNPSTELDLKLAFLNFMNHRAILRSQEPKPHLQ